MNTTFKLLCLLFAGFLAGCSAKPPGCADPETLATLKNLVTEQTTKPLAKEVADDPENWIAKFVDALSVQVSGIVSDGYVEAAKKQLCRGTMKLTLMDGAKMELPVSYSTQRTEDQKGAFLLELQAIESIVTPTVVQARQYYLDNRWTGQWSGTYSCAGLDGAADGPQGPFSMQVAMNVKGTKATLERTTLGGGIEKLEGAIDWIGLAEPFSLRGEGQNSPDDTWSTRFTGKVDGLQVKATGKIRVAGLPATASSAETSAVARACALDLTLAR